MTVNDRQSRRMSLVESVANVFVGYWVAVLSQIAVFPLFGLQVTLHDTLLIGGIFTGISIARSYALRRLFEAFRVRQTVPNAIWRVHDYADGWIYYDSEKAAQASKEAQNGALVEPMLSTGPK